MNIYIYNNHISSTKSQIIYVFSIMDDVACPFTVSKNSFLDVYYTVIAYMTNAFVFAISPVFIL